MDGCLRSGARVTRHLCGGLALMVGSLVSASCRPPRILPAQELSDRWVEVETAHVHLESDIGARRAEEVAWTIEDLYQALLPVFPRCHVDRVPPIQATVFARNADFREVAPDVGGMMVTPHADLLHFDTRILLPYEQRLHLVQVVAHELTHRLIAICMPSAPVWLHEGLAAFFETVRVHDDRIVVGTPPYHFNRLGGGGSYVANGLVVREVGLREVPSVPALISLSSTAFYEPDGGRANYAGAWLLIHYLMLGPDRALRDRFSTYLAQLAEPVAATESFAQAFAHTGLQASVAEYARSRRRLVRRVPYAPSPIRPVVVPMSSAAVHTRLAELLVRHEEGYPAARGHLEWADDLRSVLLRATMAEGEERAALMETAMMRAPEHLDVLYARARIAVRERDEAAATELIEVMMAREDLRPWDRVVLGQLLSGTGRLLEALEQASLALAAERASWEALALQGAVLVQLGRGPEAVRPLEMALVLVAESGPERSSPIAALLEVARGAPGLAAPDSAPDADASE